MANSNVRFYKLGALPTFEEKHKGIFVHVTSNLTRTLNEGNYNYSWGGLSSDAIQKIVIQNIVEKETPRPVLVPEWMNVRRIDIVESGLWFGGENGWELLSNDTTSGAIDAAINDKIATLTVEGYAQATMDTNVVVGDKIDSKLTILGIKEDDGKISNDSNNNVNIAIDGVYNESTNKIATKSTVTKAIEALDVNTIQAVTTGPAQGNSDNTVLTFKGIKEVDGKIAQGDDANPSTFIVGDAKLKIQIGSNEAGAFEVFSANKQSDSTIKLDGLVFKKDGDVISVITPTAVSESNKLVTQQDIASINGAMHYQGSIANASAWPSTTPKKGDVYIATGNFEKDSNIIQSGDMIVFGDNGSFTVVQSNITLGTGDGQIAKNVGVLATGNNVVIATSGGIKTIDITETQLTGADNNKRDLSIGDGEADTTGVCHDVTITDALTVIGKPFTKSIDISSTNRSIEIKKKTVDGVDTGVMVDLVWNTRLD